ncbi:transporter substrate-binding domain-containing protein [Aurantimonas aggregata]|uniref:Transporter substrate-binding domain-containing protein n=1 Tax=Aurantimonas aggregata TaxID=2047720 RepID=A0A6L9MJ47_9HYPH|nr:transporter substrate-binding domain-containing protein [Aurantimonas aggregata]NDV87658.1 transporter substrate-binding domain-containing protein [Aurantimonas aggregata]
MRNTTSFVLAMAATALASGSIANAASLDEIKERGKIVIGVKADYKPFGFRDPSGAIVGIEPDLAAALAETLGVELELVPVISANRIEFLQQGRVDALIATMSDKPERRKSVQAIEPLYYSDSVNVLVNDRANITSWEDLSGKPVCATSGAWYNKNVEQEYGAEIVAFDGSDKPLLALQQGKCVGYVYDQSYIQGQLLDPSWEGNYSMPLEGILETPWMMAVANGNDSLQKAMEEETVKWLKDGTIVELEEKYGIQPSAYSQRMHQEYESK